MCVIGVSRSQGRKLLVLPVQYLDNKTKIEDNNFQGRMYGAVVLII